MDKGKHRQEAKHEKVVDAVERGVKRKKKKQQLAGDRRSLYGTSS